MVPYSALRQTSCHNFRFEVGRITKDTMAVLTAKASDVATTNSARGRPVVANSSEIKFNRLLAALPDAELKRWRPGLELVDLHLGQVLYESRMTEHDVFFPTSAIVSLLYVMENGDSAELALVGNEGVVGISLFMGDNSTPSRAVVQSEGKGYRLNALSMKEKFGRGGPAMHLLLRYTQALITQMSQTAVCNRHHSLDQQLCRWLLLSLERLPGNELVMTQVVLGA